jgi:fucose 4-O-acetylase-like acetyltransferase
VQISVPHRSPPIDAAPDRRLSAAIGIARVLCILGIVYVHAWTGQVGDVLARLHGTPQGLLRWALIELLGRSAVPLLSLISGWLAGASLARRGWRSFVAGKARMILAPMVVWNALAILLVSSAAHAGWIQAPQPTSWRWTLNELLCLVAPADINVQMAFLRDLFLCLMAAPLLVRLPDRALWAIMALTAAWTISGVSIPLLLRPPILMFFAAGILVRRRGLAAWLAQRPLAPAALAYALFVVVRVWLEVAGVDRGVDNPALLAAIDLAMRAATALVFWRIAWRLAGSAAAQPLLRIEPYAFLIFCSHLIMIWLGGPLIGQLTGPLGSPLYPIFLLAQPLLVLAAALLLGRALKASAPPLASLLSGGRLVPPLPAMGAR